MAGTQSLMRTNQCRINDTISIYVPTIGEIYDYGDDEYYRLAQFLTSVPYDMMVQLDDIGIDYETISEYQLFLMLMDICMKQQDLSIIFGKDFPSQLYVDEKKNQIVDKYGNCIINQAIQRQISNTIRKIHFWKKTTEKAGNEAAKKYLIERKRVKQLRRKRNAPLGFLDESIIILVNTEEFKYNYEQCMDLSIFKFNASLHQIPKKKNWEQVMAGAYFGTLDLKKMDIEKIHWMSAI